MIIKFLNVQPHRFHSKEDSHIIKKSKEIIEEFAVDHLWMRAHEMRFV